MQEFKDLTPTQQGIAKGHGYCSMFFTPDLPEIGKGVQAFAEKLNSANKVQFYLHISQIQNYYAIKLALAISNIED